MFPFPSIGFPSASTTLPTIFSPTLIEAILCVRFTVSPSFICFEGPNNTTPTLSSSRFKTIPSSPESNSISSPYCTFERPYTRAIPSPTCKTVPTSSKEAEASNPVNCCFKIAETSAGLISAIIYIIDKFVLLLNSCLMFFNLFLKLALY